jgi:guanylate kinase
MVVRVATARAELEAMRTFDYVVVNRDGGLDACADAIASIIDAEKSRVARAFGGHVQAQARHH